MTTYCPTYTARRPVRGVFIFLLLIVAAITIYLGSHALKHGSDALDARNCIKDNGVWKMYQEPKPRSNTYHLLCMDPVTKTVFDVIVEKIDEMTYREKTAFRPKGGNWESVRKWLELGENRGGAWQNPPGEVNLIP